MSELEPLSDGPSTASGSPLPLVAVVLGAAGLIAGIVGVVLAGKAGKAADAAKADAEARVSAAAGQIATLQTELADLNTRLIRVGDLVTPLQRELGALRGSADRFRAIETAIGEDRAAINQLSEKLGQIESSGGSRRASGGGSGSAPVPEGKYVIQSGDTFGKIAARFNTTIDAIQAVNPGVDPRRLQVGQQINLPKGN